MPPKAHPSWRFGITSQFLIWLDISRHRRPKEGVGRSNRSEGEAFQHIGKTQGANGMQDASLDLHSVEKIRFEQLSPRASGAKSPVY